MLLNIEKIVKDLINQKFSIINQIFEDHLLNLFYNEIQKIDLEEDLENAGIGRNKSYMIEKNVRSNKIKWLDGNNHSQKLLFKNLENIRLELNKNLMLGLFDFEGHFAIYKNGDFYKRHFDSFKGNKNRIISLVIYLNKNWQEKDGGVLNLYQNINDDKPIFSVNPNFGNAILFLSEEIPHEVTISKKTRYSIAIWFKARNL